MSLIYSIHQPSYFPWLGLLHKIHRSDVFIVMDEVQLADRAYQNRNIFLTNNGKTKFLSIPIEKKEYRHKFFKELRIADPHWGQLHRNFIWNNYRKHPGFEQIFPDIEEVLSLSSPFLIDIVVASMLASMRWFGIDTELRFQSELIYDRSTSKGDLILQLLKACDAKAYISGRGAVAYQQDDMFEANGIQLSYADFSPRAYPQISGDPFVSGLSCIDLVCNLGIENAPQYLI